jgi:hypothetical protein
MSSFALQKHLIEIQNLVSCPPKIYSQLYLFTLGQFIALNPSDLVKERLVLSIAVLKLRRGVLLPKNNGAEAIAAEEAQWTYALFSASLLKELSSDVISQIIPKIADEWIKNNIFLYQQWKEALKNECHYGNDINKIILRAKELIKCL